MLNISNISITFNSGTTDAKKALSDLSIKVNDGDFITSERTAQANQRFSMRLQELLLLTAAGLN